MAIEFIDGFNTGVSKPEWTTPQGGTSGIGPRTGSGLGSISNTLNLTPTALKTCGFAYWTSGGTHSDQRVCSVVGVGGILHLTLHHDGTRLKLLRGPDLYSGGVEIASASVTYPNNQWHYIEVQATIADAGGRCIVRQNGAIVIDYTGDTRNGGANANIYGFAFNHASSTGRVWDDMYVTNDVDDTANTGRPDNSFLGDVKVETLIPNADGASSQWIGSDGNSVNNYQLIDDGLTTNTGDYVGSGTPGDRDLYNLPALSAAVQTVLAVRTGVYASKSDAGAAGVKTVIRESDGTITAENTNALSTSWTHVAGLVRPNKPGGGAWSVADINGLQVGVEATA